MEKESFLSSCPSFFSVAVIMYFSKGKEEAKGPNNLQFQIILHLHRRDSRRSLWELVITHQQSEGERKVCTCLHTSLFILNSTFIPLYSLNMTFACSGMSPHIALKLIKRINHRYIYRAFQCHQSTHCSQYLLRFSSHLGLCKFGNYC